MKNGYDRYLDKQFRQSGGFFSALFDAIAHADGDNLDRLAKGFPSEVAAYITFTRVGRQEFLDKCTPGSDLLTKVLSGECIL